LPQNKTVLLQGGIYGSKESGDQETQKQYN
jgi:hypothetical protein